MLSAFVIAQLVFDVAVVALAAVYILTRRPPQAQAPEPPEWYAHFLKLAQDLMAATEPVLERLESRGAPDVASRGHDVSARGHDVAAWARPDTAWSGGGPSWGAGDAARARDGSSGDWRTRAREAGSQSEFGAAETQNMGGSGRPPSPPTLRAGSESRPSANAVWGATAAAPTTDRYEKARALLRSGAQPDEVAAHAGLSPGELKLLARVVAAEARPRSR